MVLRYPMMRTLTLLGCLAAIAACGDDEPQPKPVANDGGAGGAGGGGAGGAGGAGGEPIQTWELDRSTPLSTDKPAFGDRVHQIKPNDVRGDARAPYPTDAPWMNFVLGEGKQRIHAAPYDLKALGQELSISRPQLEVDGTSITTPDVSQLRLSARQVFSSHAIREFDPLSVTVEWTAGSGTMRTPIVYGMPYVTAFYAGVTPSVLAGEGVGIIAVNGSSESPASVTSERFEVSLNNGQTWILYASPAIKLEWDAVSMKASEPYVGSLRVALRPEPNAAPVLDEHAAVIPTGGDIEVSVTGDIATVRFVWKTEGEGDLLTMALPHHIEYLEKDKSADITYPTTIGKMKGVVGSTWEFSYPLSTIGWDAPRRVADAWGPAVVGALEEDGTYRPDAAIVGSDPYLGGKQMAKLARLAQIAEALVKEDLAEELRARLKPLLNAWLDGTNANPLVYDTTWGGLVTTKGVEEPDKESGEGYYSKNHINYGYFLYAAAVLAKSDEAWRAKYADKVLWLVRDIANPSARDPYFTPFRHMDWFRGHSWSSGLMESADGRSHESTSETVNAWYSVQLLGEALENEDLKNLGRVLLAVETASAQTYWQIKAQSNVYEAPFNVNRVVGNIWGTKVTSTSRLGTDPAFSFGLQILPITPISESLLAKQWIEDAWPSMEEAAAGAEDPWRALLIAAQATLDREAAWEEAVSLDQAGAAFDDGLSRTALLYWIATRPAP